MKRRTIRVTALALLLSASLCACGGGASSGSGNTEGKAEEKTTAAQTEAETRKETETEAPETKQAVPEAVLDPEEIKWGYNEVGNNDTQYWYPDGDKTQKTYVFFEDLYLNRVDGEEREALSSEIVDGHIVDYDTKGKEFDFVFTDVFTCYDLVSGQWYMRSSYDQALETLTAAVFVCEAGDQWKIAFHEDGTVEYDCDGKNYAGTWWFEDACTVNYSFDGDDGYSGWFKLHYEDTTWKIVSIEDTDLFYPEQ